MGENQRILLTGATGFLGRRLASHLLCRGHALVCLVRADDDIQAGRLLRTVLSRSMRASGRAEMESGRLLAVAGDLSRPRLGLRRRQFDRLASAKITSALHAGAEISMDPRDAALSRAVNVKGTRRLAAAALALGIPRFHFISTVHVHGRRRGRAFESELPESPDHRNPYERAKWEGERLLGRFANRGLEVTIYRPAIAVARKGEGAGTRLAGVYPVLRLLDLAARLAARGGGSRRLRILCGSAAASNLVPVDFIVAAISRIVETPALHGTTYQIANRRPVRHGEIVRVLQRLHPELNVQDLPPERAESAMDLSQAERRFISGRGPLASYQEGEPEFDTSRLDEALRDSGIVCQAIDESFLRDLFLQACMRAGPRPGTAVAPRWPRGAEALP